MSNKILNELSKVRRAYSLSYLNIPELDEVVAADLRQIDNFISEYEKYDCLFKLDKAINDLDSIVRDRFAGVYHIISDEYPEIAEEF